MPNQWDSALDTHRRQVRDGILHATAALVAESGLRAVTMSAIAERTGIGRATLYRHFPDIEAILFAWHEQQIAGHLAQLVLVREQSKPEERLERVLRSYTLLSQHSHGYQDSDIAALLHRHGLAVRGRRRVRELLRDLLTEGVDAGAVRDDTAPEELADYCIHAVTAASGLRSKAAVHRLGTVILDGLRPPR